MKVPAERQAIALVSERVAELVGVDKYDLKREVASNETQVDAVVSAGAFTFVVEWMVSGAAGPVAAAGAQVLRHAELIDVDVVPLVAVPFMGEAGRRWCDHRAVSWLDLSGNARISAPGLRIVIDGRPNRFKRRGRPASVFAPRSSRITRWFLFNPNEAVNQRKLAAAAILKWEVATQARTENERDDSL